MSNKTYQQLQVDLEEIVERMERGDYLDVEELLKDHEQGMTIIKLLEEKLTNAQIKIEKITSNQSSKK